MSIARKLHVSFYATWATVLENDDQTLGGSRQTLWPATHTAGGKCNEPGRL